MLMKCSPYVSTQCLFCVRVVRFWCEWQPSWQRVTVLSLGVGSQGCFCSHHTLRRICSDGFMDGSEDGIGGIFLPCFACLINVLRCMSLYLKPGNWKWHRLKNENYCACGISDGAGDEWPPTILVSVVCLSLSNWLLFSVCKKCSVNCSKCGSLFYIVHVPRAERFMFCQRCTWVDTIRLTILLSREGKISWVVL